jgi:hypothetical protein
VPVFLVLAVVAVWLVWKLQGPSGRFSVARSRCRWSRSGGQSGVLVEYRCATCGVTAFSASGGAPKQCKKDIGPTAL